MHLKTSSSFLMLMFWISSWFPTSLDKWSVFVFAGSTLGLIAAHLFRKLFGELGWLAKATSALAIIVLIGGVVFVLMRLAERTSVDAGITFFYALGGVGYLFLIRSAIDPRPSPNRYRGTGLVVLSLLAIWSWASAISMYSHRGVLGNFNDVCILAPNPKQYDKELTSILEMRFPQIASARVRPSGSYIWEYHAILIAQNDGRAQQYNWSKKWIRFEILDPSRNPYLPTRCP